MTRTSPALIAAVLMLSAAALAWDLASGRPTACPQPQPTHGDPVGPFHSETDAISNALEG
jgi:hypothetical protein